ncbi:MAG TPA: amino acid permease [Chthoniobacterales bacterium]|jgi:APA family basic amino acid/polyamine antiporter|nr:amino acid permease [Chthoniobacterales bacterium]
MRASAIVDPNMDKSPQSAGPNLQTTRRTVGFFTACGIVIANIIGTGVFTSLGFQVADIQSGFALLMLWIVGGIAALCGALCYGELSAALPRSGGEYHFLSEIYHPAIGFMAGFISATVGFAAPIALAAMAFGRYFHGVFNFGSPILLSFVLVWITALFHFGNLRLGSAFQNLWTIVKLVLIAALIGAGLLVEQKQPITFLPHADDTMSIFSGAFAVALVYVMYSYSGWNASSYIIGEVKDPERNVPRSLLFGTIIVMAAYVLLNAVFLATTPEAELRGQLEVGLIAGRHIFGNNGGDVVGAIICLGLISSISSMTWIGPRVTMSMGEDHWFLRFLGRKNSEGVPANAVLVQLLIVNLLLLTRSFELVVVYIQFALLLCSLLTVIGVIVLRVARPNISRPYRVWLYPAPPIVFGLITIWMMIYLLRSKTTESVAGLATAIAGLFLYFCARKRVSAGQW